MDINTIEIDVWFVISCIKSCRVTPKREGNGKERERKANERKISIPDLAQHCPRPLSAAVLLLLPDASPMYLLLP